MATLEEVIAASPARLLDDTFFVLRTDRGQHEVGCFAVVADGHEVTLIVSQRQDANMSGADREGPFLAIRLEIATPFGAPGFIAAATGALADSGLNAFVISTFSYDYIFIRVTDRDAALSALSGRGFPVEDESGG
ncbi:MAG TPA: ACT domain-containing protein [Solirubrobacteraceae bacterium]|nr:ACT domain-containing protein [Solirubrobacteraceae bacterium]